MEEKKFPELPKFVLNSERKRTEESNFNNSAKDMSNAYKALRGMPDLRYALPPTVAEINEEWLAGEIERRQKGIKKTPFPQKDKLEMFEKWDAIGDEAKPFVRTIQAFFADYPIAKVEISNDDRVTILNRDEISECFGKLAVPALAQEHFNRFCSFKRALKELRDFEAENGIYSFSLSEILPKTSSPQFFAEVWASGNFLKMNGKFRDVNRDMAREKSLCMSEGRQYDF